MMARSAAPHGPDTLAQDQPHHLESPLRRTAGPYKRVKVWSSTLALNDLHGSGVTSGGIDPREVSAMDGNVWRPAHLTSEQMEERRLAAARLLRQGRLSQAEIARQLGVSRASVSRWAATLAQ
ncbi:MAG: helix-turn-helix domain-containing protein, partial [Microvirga sp.]